jgi:hypothetical protein
LPEIGLPVQLPRQHARKARCAQPNEKTTMEIKSKNRKIIAMP